MYTKPQTEHHITEILLWCVVVTSFMASRITDLPNIPPSGSVSVSQPLNFWIQFLLVQNLKVVAPVWLLSSTFELVFAYISICSCGRSGAQRGWGEWCWWLWLVLDWGRKRRGGLDELHQHSRGVIRDMPGWLSELKPDRGEGITPRGANSLDQREMTSLDCLEEGRVEDNRTCLFRSNIWYMKLKLYRTGKGGLYSKLSKLYCQKLENYEKSISTRKKSIRHVFLQFHAVYVNPCIRPVGSPTTDAFLMQDTVCILVH